MIVVVGVDDSPHAADVVHAALEEARRRDGEVHAVHVFNPPVAYLDVPVDLEAVADAERRAVWEPLAPILAASDLRSKRVDLDGYPPDTLVEYAREAGASLVVVGTRGRGELASLVLGSTSHRTIHLAHCDVLVVKPKT